MKMGFPLGCGQCLPCRINRRREWTLRLILESTEHTDMSFVTLTYDEENLPKDGSLVPGQVSLFVRYLRRYLKKQKFDSKIRYYAVGEYGDKSMRPHYHIALFGYPSCCFGYSRRLDCSCVNCSTLRKIWKKGGVHLGNLTKDSIQYICQYVTKKITKTRQFPDLVPEFSRMSLKPAIGYKGVQFMIDYFNTELGQLYLQEHGDIPHTLRFGSKVYPLGRYLKAHIKSELGLPTTLTRDQKNNLKKEYDSFVIDHYNLDPVLNQGLSGKDVYVSNFDQEFTNLENRLKIFSKGSVL